MLKKDIENYAMSEPLDRFVPVEIDIETPEGGKVKEKYGVKGIPHMVFLDKDGKVVKSHVGVVKKEDLGTFFAEIKS